MNEQNVVYLHDGILFNHRKECKTHTCYSVGESQKHAGEQKPDTKEHILYWFHVSEISRIGKFTDRK